MVAGLELSHVVEMLPRHRSSFPGALAPVVSGVAFADHSRVDRRGEAPPSVGDLGDLSAGRQNFRLTGPSDQGRPGLYAMGGALNVEP